MSHLLQNSRSKAGFTLIELLVCIAIIAMLTAILLPVLSKARAAVRTTVCATNLRQYGIALHTYAGDNRDRFFPGRWSDDPPWDSSSEHNWGLILSTYLDQRYGMPDEHHNRHWKDGIVVKPGTVHACPSEQYFNGIAGSLINPLPLAQGAIGYGARSLYAQNSGRYMWTSYAANEYAIRRDRHAQDDAAGTTSSSNILTWSQPTSSRPLPRISQKLYPSDLWIFGEGYFTVKATALINASPAMVNHAYYKTNFERHAGTMNVMHLDGHVKNIGLTSRVGVIATHNSGNAANTRVDHIKIYKHWGWYHNSSKGW